MKRELDELLRQTDGQIAPPAPPGDLARRIRTRHTRRTIVRRSAAACGVALAAALIGFSLFQSRRAPSQIASVASKPPSTVPAQSPAHLDRSKREIIALSASADLHERTADLLLARSAARRRAQRSPPDAVDLVQRQRDRAALILVYEADRYRTKDRPREALAGYRRAIDLFPQSTWAAVAAERIRQMSAG